jgi:FKBP-type peptidyl-prolyl cis-trans isomerase FkpA
MLKKTKSYFVACACLATSLMFSACNEFTKTESGLSYKIYTDSAGDNYPAEGGFIDFKFQMWNEKGDSLLDDQFKDMYPVRTGVLPITYRPSIEEGLRLLTPGDSAVFLLNADSLFSKTFRAPLPPYIKPGETIRMVVKMLNVYSKKYVDSVQTVMEKQMEEQVAVEKQVYITDSVAIQKYLKANKLQGQATIGGAYVVKTTQNKATDVFLAPGDTVKVQYTGKLLKDLTVFDASKEGDNFQFILGMEQVIKGWDQGFQKLKKGEKAIILIPSRLAYGSQGAGEKIPPYSPLLFEVEVK